MKNLFLYLLVFVSSISAHSQFIIDIDPEDYSYPNSKLMVYDNLGVRFLCNKCDSIVKVSTNVKIKKTINPNSIKIKETGDIMLLFYKEDLFWLEGYYMDKPGSKYNVMYFKYVSNKDFVLKTFGFDVED